jgi:RNA polymerase sigma-70 factor, ECF subfamily
VVRGVELVAKGIDMNDPVTPPEAAASFRPRLLALAYRMLGTVADAEDAVQDAYLRFQQAGGINDPEAWLVKATTRLCIDRLRRAKRREGYVGPWLPEPVGERWGGAERLELVESLSMAFLVLLETLSPAERAAFLLREVFGYEFDEIGELLDKTPVNARQIVARARKRLDLKERRFAPASAEADELAERFVAACRSGDVSAIESMLAPGIVFHSDGGGKVHAAPRPVTGAHKVANLLAVVFRKRMKQCELSLMTVNGQRGVAFTHEGRAVQVYSFSSEAGAITQVFTVLNPDKLSRWAAPAGAKNLQKEQTDGTSTELPGAHV